MHKKAKSSNAAYAVQDKKDNEPHGWIQWNGTDVCMDIHCVCGKMSHVDGEFAYHVRCPGCGRVYYCNGHIEFIEIEEPDGYVLVGDE